MTTVDNSATTGVNEDGPMAIWLRLDLASTTANGKIRNAANGFTAPATTAGAVIPPDGAYIKPLTGPRDHFGAVYNTAGMSGLTGTEAIDHSAMYVSYNNVGTVNLNDSGFMVADISNGLVTKRGSPSPWYQTSVSGTDFRVVYIRRKDAAAVGIVYAPQFSRDLINWADSAATPTVIADGGEVEAVSVEYPLFPAGRDASFFRLGARTTH